MSIGLIELEVKLLSRRTAELMRENWQHDPAKREELIKVRTQYQDLNMQLALAMVQPQSQVERTKEKQSGTNRKTR